MDYHWIVVKGPAIVAVAVCVDPIIELVLLTNGPSPNFDNCYHLIESVIPGPHADILLSLPLFHYRP